MKRWLKILIGALALAVLGFAAMVLSAWYTPDEAERNAKFITANPLDLSQIRGFSKYRSCEGHDYRYGTIDDDTEDTPRSLKHYVTVLPEYRGTVDQVDVYAPFDGEISAVEDDRGGPGDQQIWLTPNPNGRRQWHFIFFHIALDEGLKEGSPVTAGQHIGTANLKRGPTGGTENFDIAVKFTRALRFPVVDAPLEHATEEVLDEYRQYGIDPDDFVLSEEYRDNNPCPIVPGSDPEAPDFPPSAAEGEQVLLER